VLVVEVSESSLPLDRDDKGSLYAGARLEDYWIVNLVDRVLEIHRQPVADPAAPHGWRDASKTVLGPDGSASMLAWPGVALAVRSLLP
jgi:putative restriction endonuclease